jgi:hypothetical protein
METWEDHRAMQNRPQSDPNALRPAPAPAAMGWTWKSMLARLPTIVITILLCLLATELFFGAYHWFKKGEIIWSRSIDSGLEPESRLLTTMVISPFFGYTMRQGWYWTPPREWLRENFGDEIPPDYLYWRANNYGFVSDRDYPTADVSNNDFVVGVFGSSVAQNLAFRARDAIVRALRQNPALADRNIVVLNFTQGGFKQPQQLLVLNYFVALGQRFDLIINMDGVTGAYIGWENVTKHGIDPLMPTARYVFGLQNFLVNIAAAHDAEIARERIARIDRLMQRARSAMAYYALMAVRSGIEQRQAQIFSDEGRAEPRRTYMIQLNEAHSSDFASHVDRIADVWARSSLAMASIARQIGAAYIHILEPNQYLGRKPLSPVERQRLAAATEPMTEIVPPMYAALFAASKRLAGHVHFLDATGAFEGHDETLYIDHCCHFNRRGYDLLVDKLLGPELQNIKVPVGGDVVDSPIKAGRQGSAVR